MSIHLRWSWAVALTLLLGGAAAGASSPVRPAVAEARAALVRRLPEAQVELARSTGVARFVRLPSWSAADLATGVTGDATERVRAFLSAHGSLFGIESPPAELFLTAESTDPLGFQHLTYHQFYRGLPVFAGILRAHLDAAGRLRSVQGTFVPDVALDVRPNIDAAAARESAVRYVAAQLARRGAVVLAEMPALIVYRQGLERGRAAAARLAWSVEVTAGADTRALVIVDALLGKVIDWLPRTYDADRRAYSGLDVAALDGIPDSYPGGPDWVEGDPYPTGIAELDGVLAATLDTDRFFAALGRDSYDGLGHTLDISWNRPPGCPNAAWNGLLATFCGGFAVHDVVAHEWGHAYTQFTADLVYRWQSGALNESFSDVWGEANDLATQLADVRDTDLPSDLRADGACSGFLPARLHVGAPVAIAGDYHVAQGEFGPPAATMPETALIRVEDGAMPDPHDACEPFTQPALAGHLAFADRVDDCDYETQARNAQAAGAVGLVIGNLATSVDSDLPPLPICDVGTGCDLTLTLPVVSLARADADALRAVFPAPVSAAILPGDNAGASDSVRWLLGEDVRPLGVARDMWQPSCLGDPARVSDPLYFCGNGDNGGVHRNSGVPNHAFALLVDGGNYGGTTVLGIGLAKAAQVYWRAESVYEVPVSDFADHADALEAACDDLIGTPVQDPWHPKKVVIHAPDCAQVAAAAAAVELRADPPCGYHRLLAPDPPALCGAEAIYPLAEWTFDDDDGGWTASRRAIASPASFDPRDWTRVSGLPDRRPGFAFHAPDPKAGVCVTSQANDDESGVLVLESPQLLLPIDGPARIAFDHYMASEKDWDGGNLKLSVEDGPWTLIPAGAFVFNPYTGPLLQPPDNTDPLAAEPAFHGTDEGSNSSSWGTSIVDLSGLVAAGERFRIRFELGSDICFGSDLGWWVDDVRLVACTAPGTLFRDGFESGDLARWK